MIVKEFNCFINLNTATEELKRKMYGCILVIGGGMKFTGIGKWLQNRVALQIPYQHRTGLVQLSEHNFITKMFDSCRTNGYCDKYKRHGSSDDIMEGSSNHVLFRKCTRTLDIISRMDSVGAELNAYTTKEKTCIYATCLSQHLGRAAELIADIAFDSIYPAHELEKEKHSKGKIQMLHQTPCSTSPIFVLNF